ncbi:tRNA epoxyqueuosine(34) reductase QueG [Paenibacillus polymyxa]|uniref:tRNA epoxyqueuosine(34) reductase QueG n=1 Tax=Paenibacillus TaxID=44249 RepID=UPI000578171F|nr:MULTISPECIES: tRNA epoxyqueuosine(34) reductase QueG [Paenibacillus]KAF6615235.1 tRNA epoxyqueuosine(34) reductase QueG [Paenibacillus sp. EKM101P]KAF6618837.1 tRNA epoxyqueuosine(34) reductase QueG [Paenibacillus sp. EKM102P]KAF6627141.1 tRNA epoxyqueuosine(34) reductase QueG [Paenibacillus sp. EKM10P]KAF6643595.1 tRNA epoxyqueuosine(34) reductase QueG [Paenibacillus sp. EKM11P]UNL95393.1 tRNA epoxyqueuosine(34) reductase QueG [Paenibacillus polymyxa]
MQRELTRTATGTASTWASLKQEIIEAAPGLGIDSIGFASADPFLSLKAILEEHRAKGYESGFEEPDIDKRIYPELYGSQPASLIAIAVAYPSKMKDPPKSDKGKYRGIMARSAWGKDYHLVLREAMEKLEAFISERVPDALLKNMVDTGELSDRAVAERAGIGFSGKNTMMISPTLGSWIYLGELLTNIPFQPDEPVTDGCGECTKCLDACPTGALVGPGQLNAQRCVSFLTQTKGFLDEEFMLKIGNRLYGCDTCQIVCPKNRGLNWDHHPELTPDPEIVKPLLLPLLDLSNREFKDRFGQSAAAWRGKKPIQRNAVIGLGNFKDVSAVPKLTEVLLDDPRPELRGTAAWALSRIGGENAMTAIKQASEKEQHEQVREMIAQAHSKLAEQEQAEQQTSAELKTEDSQGPTKIYYDEMETPVGTLTLCATDRGLCRIDYSSFYAKEALLQQWARTWVGEYVYVQEPEKLREAAEQLREYFAGERREFSIAYDLRGTPFQEQVWRALQNIPYGQSVSYQDIAESIGRAKAIRAVGEANNKNPLPILFPCHRVSGANGSLVGYAGGLPVKMKLLDLEKE